MKVKWPSPEREELEQKYPGQWLRRLLLERPEPQVLLLILLGGGLERMPLAAQVIVVVLALSISCFFAGGLLTSRGRATWLRVAKNGEKPSPFRLGVYTLLIWGWATLAFAGLSGLLYMHGIATTVPKHAVNYPVWDSAVNFYAWKSLDAIPVVEIPQTAGWEPAFQFTDHVSPILLLLYKVIVITPVIETGWLIWNNRRDRGAGGGPGPEAVACRGAATGSAVRRLPPGNQQPSGRLIAGLRWKLLGP
jgi:hypothetical protein